MQPEIPHFILKGSSVLSTLVHELSFGPVQFQLSPLLIRNLKFCTADEDQQEMYLHLLSLFHGECSRTQLQTATPRDVLLRLCALAIKRGVWYHNRQSEMRRKLEQHCPHVLMHNLPKALTFCKDNPALEPLSSSESKALLIRTRKLNDKMSKLKSLKQSKKSLQSQLRQHLNDVKLSQETALSTKMIENALNGVDLSEASMSLMGEIDRFHDILAYLEQDIKDEELFWRWIVGSEEQPSTSESEPSGQVKRAINDTLCKFDGRVQELLKTKSVSENGNIAQVPTAAEDEVRAALLSFSSSLASQESDSLNDTGDPFSGEVAKTTISSLLQLFEEVLARSNLVSPRMAVLRVSGRCEESTSVDDIEG